MLSVIMQNVVMLGVIMLGVTLLNVVMLSVVSSLKQNDNYLCTISGLYYKTITIVIDAPSVVKSDAPNCSVTY